MLLDASLLIESLFREVDGTVTARVCAAIVLVLAVIGSWGTFAGGGDVGDVDVSRGE